MIPFPLRPPRETRFIRACLRLPRLRRIVVLAATAAKLLHVSPRHLWFLLSFSVIVFGFPLRSLLSISVFTVTGVVIVLFLWPRVVLCAREFTDNESFNCYRD